MGPLWICLWLGLMVFTGSGSAGWLAPVIPALRRPRQTDHISARVQDQPGQQSETKSLQTINKITGSDSDLCYYIGLILLIIVDYTLPKVLYSCTFYVPWLQYCLVWYWLQYPFIAFEFLSLFFVSEDFPFLLSKLLCNCISSFSRC